MQRVICIILARGGSKTIPLKNIINFCGKPLIAWTIEKTYAAGIDDVYVSSDSDEILGTAIKYGAKTIKRPEAISGDQATSESGWIHSINLLNSEGIDFDWVFAPQVTSPLTTSGDIQNGVNLIGSGKYDSLFSCCPTEDLFLWSNSDQGFDSINYDWRNRKRRQDTNKQYVENGSFYFFKPKDLVKNNNRLSGKIGMIPMEFWQMFEIDSQMDLRLCSAIMKEFIL